MTQHPESSRKSSVKSNKAFISIRIILAVLMLLLCGTRLFITFDGLGHASVMNQAQIARNLAQGNGMTSLWTSPLDLIKANKVAEQEALASGEPDAKPVVDLAHFPNIHEAPLNICFMAVALRLTGYHDFYAKRAELEAEQRLTHGNYPGDRVIAATSTIFFMLSMVLAYLLITRLFDEAIAASVVPLILCNETMLNYAVSGLPQPLMACCLLAALHFLLTAIRLRDQDKDFNRRQPLLKKPHVWVMLSFVCMGFMTLAGWSAAWGVVGLALFCLAYFRRGVVYAFAGPIVVFLMCYFVAAAQLGLYNGVIQYYFFCAADCLGGSGTADALRTGLDSASPVNDSGFLLRLLGYTFGQFGNTVAVMGGIFSAAFFFLALFHRYNRSEVEGFKWAAMLMWSLCALGMAMTAGAEAYAETQLQVLFLPVFLAYGIALVYNFVVKAGISTNINRARGFAFFLIFAVCCGPFISQLHTAVVTAVRLQDHGLVKFPPYYPPALYGRTELRSANKLRPGLVDLTPPQDVIVTDQPWAVAWYAQRRAVWLPKSVETFNTVSDIVQNAGLKISGILMTPTTQAISGQGLYALNGEMGEFAPLALETHVLLIAPERNIRLSDLFTQPASSKEKTASPLGAIVSSGGRFPRMSLLFGTHYILYTPAE